MLRRPASTKRSWPWLFLTLLMGLLMACSEVTLPFLSPQLTPIPSPGSLPPTVIEFSPRPGVELPLQGAALLVRFDQDMNRASVEAALHILPSLEGEFSWQGNRAVTFTPQALTAGTRYQVYLGSEARAQTGVPLSGDLAFSFSTLSPLLVTSVTPTSDAVRIDAPVLVAFNRPIVPAACAGRPAASADCPELPLSFVPAAPGQGEWVNAAVYRFTPRNVFASAQAYVATLDARVTALDGATLVVPYTWNFTTNIPQVLSVTPVPDALNQPLDTIVRVTFSTPMDQEPTATAFTLLGPDGEPVPGAITWEDGGARLIFTPATPLLLGTQYQARLGERARAATSLPVAEPFQWAFITVPAPYPVSITPEDGAQAIPVDEPVRLALMGVFDAPDLSPYLMITPTVAREDLYVHWDGSIASLSWAREPRATYCMGLQPGLSDIYGNVMAEGFRGCFTTGDLLPFLDTGGERVALVMDAAAPHSLDFAVRNVDSADFTLFALRQEAFISGRDLPGAPQDEWREDFAGVPNVITMQSVPLTRRDPLPTGYYQLSWEAEGTARDYVHLAVVDRHLTLKLAAEEALVWVTDLRSGMPISRTEVRLLDHQGVLVAAGTTDTEGVARIRIAPLESLWSPFAAVVGEPGRSGFGLALSSWDTGAALAEFDLAVDAGPYTTQKVYLYSDRSAYQAGQTVYFWGAQRTLAARGYVLPTNQQLEVTLRDPDYEVLYTALIALSDMGVWTGAFTLPATCTPGEYTLEATLPGVARVWHLPFSVHAPTPADFAVTVLPEQSQYVLGDTLQALIVAEYASGLPVAAAQVTWRVFAIPDDVVSAVDGDWVWGADTAAATHSRMAGEGVTDAAGRWELSLPVTAVQQERWLLEVAVTDARGLYAEGHTFVPVYPAEVQLGLLPHRWVAATGQRTDFSVLVLDIMQQPIANQPVTLRFVQREWRQSPDETAPEGYAWTQTEIPVSEVALTTDSAGVALTTFTPSRSGVYIVTAETEDTRAHIARTELQFWVGGASAVLMPTGDKLMPVADVRAYRPGDTARVLLPTPFEPPFQVLMTVEREGVLTVRQFVAEQSSPIVEIPITEAYAPNVYVGFVVIKGVDTAQSTAAVRVGYVNLPVVSPVQPLTLELLPDMAADLRPGELLTLTVRTLDADGNPVPAAVNVVIRDASLASSTPPPVPGIFAWLYGERALSVLTGDALLHAAGAWAPASVRGQSEVLSGVGMPHAALADTVYWNGIARTDTTGELQLFIPLPATSGRWIIDARAITGEALAGEAQLEIVSDKPLLVRPLTPAFLVAGDRPELAAFVYNHTDTTFTATVRLEASGVTVFGATTQEIVVPAQDWVRVVWVLDVAATAGPLALLTFSAEGGGYTDVALPLRGRAVDGALPIYRYETPQAVSIAGRLTEAGSGVEVFAFPDGSTRGRVTVRLEPSLAATLLNGLEFLQLYAHDTTEGVVSRLLGLMVTYQTVYDTEQAFPMSEVEYEAQMSHLLEQLYFSQNADGGWAWWQGESDVQMSAYAAYGLLVVRRAGFDVRQGALNAALDYLVQVLRHSAQPTNGDLTRGHAFALYVLTYAQRTWPEGAAAALYIARPALGVTGRAYLALALGSADAADPRLKTLLDTLRGEALVSGGTAHWYDDSVYAGATTTRATAAMAVLLARFAPHDPLLPQAVDWLMTRGGERWATTRETAWTLIALGDYLQVEGVSPRAYTWEVRLNDVLMQSGMAASDALTEAVEMRLEFDELFDQPNILKITRGEGPGVLYYTARTMLVTPFTEITSASRGMTLYREYCVPATSPADTLIAHLLRAPCVPVGQLSLGDEVEVRLRLVVPVTRYYVTLEDPWPAGFVGVKGGSVAPEFAGQQNPFEQCVLGADRTLFFATQLQPGVYEAVYRLRATFPGDYRALPARVYETYFPEVWARTGGATLSVVTPE